MAACLGDVSLQSMPEDPTDTTSPLAVGARIRQARQANKLTQNALASKIATTNPTFAPINVSRWETGAQRITAENARLVSQALGVSVDWILNGEEAPVVESRVEQDVFTPEEIARMTDFLGFEPTRQQISDVLHNLDFLRADWRKVAKMIELRVSMQQT